MFEQSLPIQHSKPWTFAASITLQAAFVGTAILVSLIHTDVLPMGQLKDMIPLRSPIQRAVEIVATERTSSGPSSSALHQPAADRPFTAPSRIPTAVAEVHDLDSAPVIAGSYTHGLAASTGVVGGFGDDIRVAPPLPPMVTTTVKQTIRQGGDVMEARIINRVIPVYPALAKQMRLSGEVQLLGVIAQDGTVQKLQVISGHPLLVQSALDAVRKWVYRPTLLNGVPVEVVAPITVRFSLREP
jgi:protein TonB